MAISCYQQNSKNPAIVTLENASEANQDNKNDRHVG